MDSFWTAGRSDLVSWIDHPGACCCNRHLAAANGRRSRRSWLVGGPREAGQDPPLFRVPPEFLLVGSALFGRAFGFLLTPPSVGRRACSTDHCKPQSVVFLRCCRWDLNGVPYQDPVTVMSVFPSFHDLSHLCRFCPLERPFWLLGSKQLVNWPVSEEE